MAMSSPDPPSCSKTANNQFTLKIDKLSILVWRRILLVRYYNLLGKENNSDIKWKDFDLKSKIITVSDEEKPFEWMVPHKELMKSSVDVTINNVKLCVISLFYTTQTMLIQGRNSKKWLDLEYEVLKDTVLKIVREKGHNSSLEIDKIIQNVRMASEISGKSDCNEQDKFDSSVNDSSLLEADDQSSLFTNKKQIHSDTDKKQSNKTDNQGKNNENSENTSNESAPCVFPGEEFMKEISILKESMHMIERKLVEKDEKLNKILSVCSELAEKCEKIPDIQTEVNKLKATLNNITNSTDHSVEILEKTNRLQMQINENKDLLNKCNQNSSDVKENMISLSKTHSDVIKSVESMQMKDSTQTKSPVTRGEKIAENKPVKLNFTSDMRSTPSASTLESARVDLQIDSKNSKQNSKIWIVGSSVVKDLDGRKIYRNRITRITTLRDKTIQGAVEFIKSKKINSDIIVLQIGSNDLESAEVDNVMEEYENMVEVIKKEYSNAKLVIGEVLPRYYHDHLITAEFEQKRCQFNLLLKDLCEDRNLELVQYDHVRPTNFYDGIHLNQEGIKMYVKNLKEVINPLVDVRSSENPNVENRRQYNTNQTYNGKGCQQFYQNRPIRNNITWNPGVDYKYNRYNQTNQYMGRSNYNGSFRRYHNSRANNQMSVENENNVYQLLELLLQGLFIDKNEKLYIYV